MNAKERAKAWAIDQLDPDNWLEIPEFGVLPQSVVFEGFAYPIVCPHSKGEGLRRVVREHVKTVRALVCKEKRTLAQVKASYIEVLDMLEARTKSERIIATHDQAMATYYFGAMDGASRAVRCIEGGWSGVSTKKTTVMSLDAVAQCAEAIRCMVLQSFSAKPVEILRRQIEETSTRRRNQASEAGRASGKSRSEKAKCTLSMVETGYQTLMATGTEEWEVAAKLAARHSVSPDYIRKLRKRGQTK